MAIKTAKMKNLAGKDKKQQLEITCRLSVDLTLIYERDDMCNVGSVHKRQQPKNSFDENIQSVIICTTPMSTEKCGRCCSTFKRIQTKKHNLRKSAECFGSSYSVLKKRLMYI